MSHKREERKREIPEWFCAEPSCEFFGKPVEQGICHTADSGAVDWKKVEAREAEIAAEFEHFRKSEGDDYQSWLESMYVSMALNWQFTLDEVVRLRRDNARLRLAAAKVSP